LLLGIGIGHRAAGGFQVRDHTEITQHRLGLLGVGPTGDRGLRRVERAVSLGGKVGGGCFGLVQESHWSSSVDDLL
jgi:hypothetical protein